MRIAYVCKVCTRMISKSIYFCPGLTAPFQLTVKFDATEAENAIGTDQSNTETSGVPAGTTGFYLCWEQRTDCA